MADRQIQDRQEHIALLLTPADLHSFVQLPA
jgi:hypothetical protein